jgi:anoctamin-10
MTIPVDLVLTFEGTSRPVTKQQACEDVQSAMEEYTRLINTLTNAGLKATGRRGEKQGQLMVLIWTPPRKLAQLFETQRHADFLLGLPSSLPAGLAVSPLSDANRLRLVHDYITSLKADGGLGIIPGISQWPRVESILALQDPDFNHSWITTWTRRRIGFNVGFSELNKIRDEVSKNVENWCIS